MMKRKTIPATLPGMGGTLAFGGVQLTKMDLGLPSGSPLSGYQWPQDGQQGGLWEQLDVGYLAREFGDASDEIGEER